MASLLLNPTLVGTSYPVSDLYKHRMGYCFHVSIQPKDDFDPCNKEKCVPYQIPSSRPNCTYCAVYILLFRSNLKNITAVSTCQTISLDPPLGVCWSWIRIASEFFGIFGSVLKTLDKNRRGSATVNFYVPLKIIGQ